MKLLLFLQGYVLYYINCVFCFDLVRTLIAMATFSLFWLCLTNSQMSVCCIIGLVIWFSIIKIFMFRFVLILFNVPVNLFSHVGTEPPLPGYYQYFLRGKCILLKGKHGDLSEDRAPDLSLRSPTPYH